MNAALLVARDLVNAVCGPIALDLAAGEILCLAGPSGSGKSLLLRALADLDPHNGTVHLADVAQEDIPGSTWRRRVALVPAECAWWAPRVGDHFTVGPDPALLAALDLTADAGDWRVERCSTGERQRLGLARALVLEPQVLLLDEPTANLDQATTIRVEDLVGHWVAAEPARAVIWVAHASDQIARLQARVLRLRDGRVEDGDGQE